MITLHWLCSRSPLYCYLGMALHSNLKTTQALEMLSNAISPRSRLYLP